jgi:uncharacterized protein YrzB (UPF0473 family)
MAEEQEVEIITISQEDGAEEDFEVVTYFEHPETGVKYVFLVSVLDAEEEEQDIYPFRYAEDGDDLVLAPVEDDDEWEMLEEILHSLIESEQI